MTSTVFAQEINTEVMTQQIEAGTDIAQISVIILTAYVHEVTSDSKRGAHDGVTNILILMLPSVTCHELDVQLSTYAGRSQVYIFAEPNQDELHKPKLSGTPSQRYGPIFTRKPAPDIRHRKIWTSRTSKLKRIIVMTIRLEYWKRAIEKNRQTLVTSIYRKSSGMKWKNKGSKLVLIWLTTSHSYIMRRKSKHLFDTHISAPNYEPFAILCW